MVAVERASRAGLGLRSKAASSKLWMFVALPVLAIPFENEYALFGLSLAKLTIIPLLLAVLLFKPRELMAVLKHRVFLCGMAFIAWGAIVEGFHPFSDWEFLYRVFQMLVFAALVGAVSPDLLVFRRTLLATAIVCSVLAFYLVYNFYGAVTVEVEDFRQAGYLRDAALSELSLATGINILGYTVGMGAIIALTQMLGTAVIWRRIVWGAIYVLCAVGSFIPLSRGAFLALVAASGLVVLRNLRGLMKPGRLLFFIGVIAIAFSLTPRALTERYSALSPEGEALTGKADGRTKIYRAALESFPEYWAFGVGNGYYWNRWGLQNGFGGYTARGPSTSGPHNGFLTAWIFFGLPGIVLLCLVCLFAARDCPKPDSKSIESTALFGLLVLALFWIMFTHSLYLKPLGVILGLLMGASYRQARYRLAARSRVRAQRTRLKARAAGELSFQSSNGRPRGCVNNAQRSRLWRSQSAGGHENRPNSDI